MWGPIQSLWLGNQGLLKLFKRFWLGPRPFSPVKPVQHQWVAPVNITGAAVTIQQAMPERGLRWNSSWRSRMEGSICVCTFTFVRKLRMNVQDTTKLWLWSLDLTGKSAHKGLMQTHQAEQHCRVFLTVLPVIYNAAALCHRGSPCLLAYLVSRRSLREAEGVSPRSISIPILKSTLETGNLFLHGRRTFKRAITCSVLTGIPDCCGYSPETFLVYNTKL